MDSIKVFIGHSSRDVAIVGPLVRLVRVALNMPTSDIHCTSLDGYRLPIGMSIPDKLRAEVLESTAFVALVTKNFLGSSYCLFEMGARWGTPHRLYPLYAGGASVRDVNAWLGEFRGADCSETAQLMQFVREIGEDLKFEVERTESFLNHIEELVRASKQAASDYVAEYGQLDPREQEVKQADMKREDGSAEMGKNYAIFWEIIRRYYADTYRPKDNPDFPPTLEGFVEAAGSPPNTIGAEFFSWPVNNVRRLTQDQRRMWDFAQKVYPSRQQDQAGDVWQYSAIKPAEEAERFHWARRGLGKYWDEWPPLVGWQFISERYQTRHHIVLLLAWLELALVQWTRMQGSHKQELFKLAARFAQVV
jgi:hypothetical protein